MLNPYWHVQILQKTLRQAPDLSVLLFHSWYLSAMFISASNYVLISEHFRLYLTSLNVGKVQERFNWHAWKACVPERVPRVRISPFPQRVFINPSKLSPSFQADTPHFCSWIPSCLRYVILLQFKYRLNERRPVLYSSIVTAQASHVT